MNEYSNNQGNVERRAPRVRTISTLLATMVAVSGIALGCDPQDGRALEPDDERAWGDVIVLDDSMLLIDELTALGSGCPHGMDTASAVLMPGNGGDDTTMRLVFDEFQAETGAGDLHDYKSCNIAVPIAMPKNMRLSLEGVDYRGEVYVPQGGQAVFNAEHFFAGKKGSAVSRTFPAGSDEQFEVRDDSSLESGCGEDVIFRINTSVIAKKRDSTPEGEETSMSTTDVGVRSGAAFHWRLEECSE